MPSFVQRSVNIGLFAAVFGCSLSAWAQDAAAPAAAADAPAAAAPAAPPAPAPAEAAPAAAEAPPALAAEAPMPEPAAAKPKPPPYSLPWQLRPAVVANVVRSDTSFAFYKNPANDESGSTIASMLLASYKVTDEIAPMIRLGVAQNSPPKAMPTVDSAFNFLNPVIGGTYAIKPAKPLRLAFFLGLTVPVGSGGGDDASPEAKAANAAGIRARSAMDNAMFAVNDFTIFPGVDFAYVSGGFTAQVEATLLQLTRVKGDKKNPTTMAQNNPDSSKTNLTCGLHVGYFVIPQLSLGAEIRHQRWVSTPKAVEADEASTNMNKQGVRDTTTWAIGPRGHFKLSESVWFRPGVSFSMPLDNPMKKAEYKVVQLDLPIAF